MTEQIYVIGHVNPDTDSIASAIGYAWLLRERDGLQTIAARSGLINQQSSWLLRYVDMEPPYLLNDASPKFESVARRLDVVYPQQPLKEAWAIANRTGGIVPILNEDGTPYGLITGESLFQLISDYVGPNPKSENSNVGDILELPSKDAADTSVQKFLFSVRIKDMLKKVLREEGDEFWVVDEEGKYKGIVHQRDILNPPRIKLILVDHNEVQQAVSSLEEAQLIEILDHHKLGNPPTNSPIRFNVEPVGSTSTLVTERISDAGFAAPPEIAILLLAGIISDTLNLISPTTTTRDHEALKKLSRWAFSGATKFIDDDVNSFAEKLLASGSGLGARPAEEIVSGDLKYYDVGEYKFGIAQAEVSDLYEVEEYLDILKKSLIEMRESKGFDFAVLMVTDVVRGSSRLLLDNQPAIFEDLPYEPNPDGTLMAEGVVSRKKQLVPAIMSLLEI